MPPEQLRVWRKIEESVTDFREFTWDREQDSVPARFEQLVRSQPDRVAVSDATGQLSYSQLNAQANRVAREIVRRSSTSPEPVGLLLEKGCSFIVGVLGALKAGKLFVPLDPAMPEARIAYILRDTEPPVIVTNATNATFARSLSSRSVSLVNLDEFDPDTEPDDLGLSIPLDNLAWLLYTSGSTGKPKGVVQTHRNVLHYVENYVAYFQISRSDRLSLLFSLAVNGAAHDIFLSLLSGASLHSFDVRSEGLVGLADWMEQKNITVYCSAPTVFSHFLDNVDTATTFPKVRLVRLIGEPVYRRHVDAFKRHFERQCVFVNRLGSTETGSILFFFLDHETDFKGNRVPLGCPVAGNDVALLGDDGGEISGEAVGEIAVKSSYLSPGYWKRPDLTEQAFVAEAVGSPRAYRMGDVGRRDSAGTFWHVGRTDSQVKIRGHRIEIGEVESTLLNLGAVKDGVVVVRDAPSGDHQLVAYLVPAQRPGPNTSQLRKLMAAELAPAMVPARFVVLDALPQAPNGKVDRKNLPDPKGTRPDLDVSFVAPRTHVEEFLTGLFANLLDYDGVGIMDSFLDLGGDSLLATRLISRVRDEFQVELSVTQVFESLTAALLAEVIERELASSDRPTSATGEREEHVI